MTPATTFTLYPALCLPGAGQRRSPRGGPSANRRTKARLATPAWPRFSTLTLTQSRSPGATHIVTFNRKDLKLASEFGITVLPPSEFLRLLGLR